MKMNKGAGSKVLIACIDGAQCPRAMIASTSMKIRDDYKGSIKNNKRNIAALFKA